MKNTLSLKLCMILTICTAYIFCFSYFGSSVYGKVFSTNDSYSMNTHIGSVDVSNKSPEEAKTLMAEEQGKWLENTKFFLQYKEEEQELDLGIYKFQFDRTIEHAQSGQENQLFVELDNKALSNLLTEMSPELTSFDFNIDQLRNDLLIYASRLKQGSHSIKLQDYFPQSSEDELIAESTTSLVGENKLIQKWAAEIPTIEILPQSQLSILKMLDEKGITSYDQKTLSIISAAIYKTVLSSNFAITERHISRTLPEYAEAGFEAKIDQKNNMDFILTNPNDQGYILHFKSIDNLLYVSLRGSRFIYQYNVSVEDKETFKPKKIIQFDAKLNFGEERNSEEGKEGILLKVYREIVDETGKLLRTELVSEDFYPPVHKVIVQSLTVKQVTGSAVNNNPGPILPGDSANGEAGEQDSEAGNNKQEDKSGQNSEGNSQSENAQKGQDSSKGKESEIWGNPDETKK
ncbi:G5 domain-containing protein [Bacillus sp. FJAT-29790]|uniref:G5 domain-containing protein n=1 Tax=Bacillus sp. FJAT-29790 TaxID=1895002 RepID=UPI001C24B0A0|nr:G5 domain-containing protein [Bacillus sp. FJAT-29790]MBU8879570.1 G5 domain-containing protein [Bacillus sp. FJAT-29790]